jgi:hypothetical protein
MDPTSTGAGGLVALKTVLAQTLIASLAGLLGYILIRPKTMREAVWRFFGAGMASVLFGPLVVTVINSHWPSLLASAQALALQEGASFEWLYFTAPIQIASGLPIWLLMGIGARWLDKNQSMALGELFSHVLNAVARSRNALKGEISSAHQETTPDQRAETHDETK